MYKVIILLLLVIVTGCGVKKGQKTIDVEGSNFELDFLFEHEGCRMYRFNDGGKWVYWSDCSGNTQSSHRVSCGKHCYKTIQDQAITTQ